MRPVKLIMSAFGSYAGRTEIDFTEIPNGLFLITLRHLAVKDFI